MNQKKFYIIFGIIVVLGIIAYLINSNSTTMSAQNGDTVFVNYTGKLVDGTKFDSSLDRGVPIDFTLGVGRVIKGWDQGILGMKVGEKKTLTIPPELGYGAQAIPDGRGNILIPANSTLIFDVELVDIKRP
jgi:FKBP-type peptidyl-prolyl cis-trans isomerase